MAIHHEKKTETLAKLLQRIGTGEDPRVLRKEASKLIGNLNSSDITIAEQNLIDHGYSANMVQQLSAAFMLMGLLEDKGINLRSQLPETHILKLVLAEHDIFRYYVTDLMDVSKAISKHPDLTDLTTEFRRLTHIIEHLDSMEEHIQREEDVIFPYLERYGWATLCRTSQSDHVYIRIAISDLIRLITSFAKGRLSPKEFKGRLDTIARYLCPILKEHLFQEDNILYPIALEVVNDPQVWDAIKDVCDEIGYCGIHL
jgi:DUF438 domain-containing protein